MKVIAGVLTYFGLFIVYMSSFGRLTGTDPSYGGVIVGGLITMFGAGLGTSALRRRQGRQDADARTVIEKGNLNGRALYLRPFSTDGRFHLDRDSGNLFSWDQYDRPGSDTLERMMAEAFAATCPLVGVGGRGGQELGAGTAGYLDDWRSAITAGIFTAGYIVFLPSANTGTLWELGELIRCQALARTIFVMAPAMPPMQYDGPVPLHLLWSEAVAAASSAHGVTLPDYIPSGALFGIDERSLSVRDLVSFQMHSPRRLANAINTVI